MISQIKDYLLLNVKEQKNNKMLLKQNRID